jgi:hypothetical protein
MSDDKKLSDVLVYGGSDPGCFNPFDPEHAMLASLRGWALGHNDIIFPLAVDEDEEVSPENWEPYAQRVLDQIARSQKLCEQHGYALSKAIRVGQGHYMIRLPAKVRRMSKRRQKKYLQKETL